MFERFDGSGRLPRQVQIDALKWIEDNWGNKILALNLPTGVGKSAILRSIQYEASAVGIVPTNILLNQYQQTYSDLNCVKGMAHYICDGSLSCEDRQLLGMKHHEDCPYVKAKQRVFEGEPTVYNPISYYYMQSNEGFEIPKVLVIDEAHKLNDLLMLLSTCSFRKQTYNYPQITNELELISWLETLLDDILAKEKELSRKKRIKAAQRRKNIEYVYKCLVHNPQDFVFYTQKKKLAKKYEEYLCIDPVRPPKWLLSRILEADKIILMSATLLESDIWDMGLQEYKYKDFHSPIPKINRPIQYKPSTDPMNWESKPNKVAEWIEGVIAKHPNLNTIVHVSYAWADKLKPYFPNALFNSADDKNEVLAKFKEQGGVWVASGCAEGIDLPNDECRLNIIPILSFADISAPVIKKRLALPMGRLKYELETLKQVIQQAGRSTRGLDDYSTTVIGDSRLPWLVSKNRKYLPTSFTEAIIWRVTNE